MRNIKEELLKRFMLALGGLVFLLLLGNYILLKSFFLEAGIAVYDLNILYSKLIGLSLFLLLLAYFFYRKIVSKLSFELENFQKYIENISKKRYDAHFKAEHFQEFLQLSLQLKNIIKRLHSKDKKKK